MSGVKKGENDICTVFPDFVKEWDYEKNNGITPDSVAAHSNKKYWWKCAQGHSYDRSPDHRSRGQACPYCSGKKVLEGFNDLKSIRPDLLTDWDYEKNIDIQPTELTAGSNKKVWWKCHTCGHEWKVSPNDRKNGLRGCPECAKIQRAENYKKTVLRPGENDLASQAPELLIEWDNEKNIGIKPEECNIHSKEKVWWRCRQCGNRWLATVSNRVVNHSGCPKCKKYVKTSFPEQAIFYYVLKHYPNAENSYTGLLNGSSMELDVYIPEQNIGIEYDGVAWHNTTSSAIRDHKKYELCKTKGIRLIRISEFVRKEAVESDVFILRKEQTDDELNAVIRELLLLLEIKKMDVDVVRDRPDIMKQYVVHIENKSIAIKYPDEVKYWDTEKNKGITPSMVNATSNVKYWWKCDLGHSYKATPGNKLSNGTGCPYCSGRKALKGFNDLATKFPQIAIQWDYEKNSSLTPFEVTGGSQKKVWWRCNKGHSYQGVILNKVATNSKCPYCSNSLTLSGYNDLKTTNPEILIEWDFEKNSIKPEEVNKSSGKKVWWKCDKGHSWSQSINIRIKGSGCPYCANLKVWKGENDLLTLYPDLAEEWDYERNIKIRPENVVPGSPKKVWWKCSKGHVFKASIASRVAKHTGCPYCANQKHKQGYNDLKSLNPELTSEWNYERNGSLHPEDVVAGGQRKVWWKCSKGHEWQAKIYSRVNGRGCPYCSNKKLLPGYNDFATVYPELLSEWNYEKNGDLKPEEISCGSMTKVWWKCSKGHEWYLSPNQRRRQDGTMAQCIYCAGKRAIPGETDLPTVRPDLMKEWNYEKNDAIHPTEVKEFSAKKVWWKCSKCGHEWKAAISNRSSGAGCPNCKNSNKVKRVKNVDTGIVYESIKDAVEKTGFSRGGIGDCCNGKRETYKGYHWTFV